MTYRTRLLAGSAVGLLALAASAAWSAPQIRGQNAAQALPSTESGQPLVILAQDNPDAAQDNPDAAAPEGTEELLPKKKPAEQPPAEETAPAEPQPEAAPAEPQPEAAPQTEPEQPATQPEAEPAPQPEPQVEPAPEPKAEQPAPEEPQAEPPAEKPQAEQPVPEPEPQPEPTQPEQPAPKVKPQAPDKAPNAEPEAKPQPEPQPEATPEEAPAPQTEPAKPTPEAAPQPEPAPETAPAPQPAPDQPAAEQPSGESKPEVAPPAGNTQQPADSNVPADSGTAEQPENAAPVLDSAKEAPAESSGGKATQTAPAEAAGPPPADDKTAQEAAQPTEVEAVTAEQGTRVDAPPPPVEQKRPQGVDVVKEVGDRVVIEINNQIFVESSDRPRMTRGARDVYYEDLPRGRTRETVVREDGTQVVTIRNSYGDIVRRSRITPDGREYVLVYVDDRYYDRVQDWRDPGADLPPMRLDVPVSQYVLDADEVEDPETYYEFLEKPPVERVERLYSVDEVKRSARIRDKVPRIELDTVTFEFGSAEIGESEIGKLEGVAKAMEKLLKRNPAETFLIEGHTDAVGSDVANLALSDRRAEAVAAALTDVFGIPPENLATQGYGERYLKIKTEERERLNRRVVMRRITTLVAPVASAN